MGVRTLDDEVARWARIRAAELNSSVSRLVGELLRQHMLEEQGYEAAKSSYLSGQPAILKTSGAHPGREELLDRDSLR